MKIMSKIEGCLIKVPGYSLIKKIFTYTIHNIVVSHLIIPLAILVISVELLYPILTHIGVKEEFLIEIIGILVGFLFVLIYIFNGILNPVKKLLSIKRKITIKTFRGAILSFIDKNITKYHDITLNLIYGGGAELSGEDITTIAQFCFAESNEIYNGVDSHPPSEFTKLYPSYLNLQAENLRKNPQNNGLCNRVLILSKQQLATDYEHYDEEYNSFLRWHIENQVNLWRIDPHKAAQLKDKYHLPTTDVGIWKNKFALSFKPQLNKKFFLSLSYPEKKNAEFINANNYIEEVLAKSERIINTVALAPSIFHLQLSEKWCEYVNCDKRMETEGPFILDILKKFGDNKNIRILDAASGIGCETIFLFKEGYDNIISNEIDDKLAAQMELNCKRENVTCNHTKHNWKKLTNQYRRTTFDLILVLGNSLCLIENDDDRRNCILQFQRILKKNGILVIDERNFRYILKDREKILENPVSNFNYSRKYMYCGNSIKGIPIEISDDEILFLCYDDTDVIDKESAIKHELGTFRIYPFKEGEMKKLLEDAGFNEIKAFSDFNETFNENADFFTYVAQK